MKAKGRRLRMEAVRSIGLGRSTTRTIGWALGGTRSMTAGRRLVFIDEDRISRDMSIQPWARCLPSVLLVARDCLVFLTYL